MYAVIATGGKQYRVSAGEEIEVELLKGDVGDTVDLRPVMLVDDQGAVTTGRDIGDATVSATITGQAKGPKITVFTYKNKSRQHKKTGHRQRYTLLKVGDLSRG